MFTSHFTIAIRNILKRKFIAGIIVFGMTIGITACLLIAIGWWAASEWLSGFAYRVNISQFIFLGVGVSAIVIAWLTVGFQSIKAAYANPADSLRHE